MYILSNTLNDGLPEHKDQKNMSNWLKQNAKDLSFDGFCDDIRYNCSIVPYSYYCGDREIHMTWDNGLRLSEDKNEDLFISEDDLYNYWDDIRREGIIVRNNNNVPVEVLDMMFSLGYFSKINIVEGEKASEGYQLNEGMGRCYSLEGFFH